MVSEGALYHVWYVLSEERRRGKGRGRRGEEGREGVEEKGGGVTDVFFDIF